MSIVDNALFTQDIPEKGAAKGHVRFNMKSRTPEDVALLAFCSNIAASLLFERMQAQGTNLIFTLGKDTTQADVLARYENDGLTLMWNPKPADPNDLASVQERIRNKTFFIGKEDKKSEKKEGKEEKKPDPKGMPKAEEKAPAPLPESMNEDEEDYLTKQLHRIP